MQFEFRKYLSQHKENAEYWSKKIKEAPRDNKTKHFEPLLNSVDWLKVEPCKQTEFRKAINKRLFVICGLEERESVTPVLTIDQIQQRVRALATTNMVHTEEQETDEM